MNFKKIIKDNKLSDDDFTKALELLKAHKASESQNDASEKEDEEDSDEDEEQAEQQPATPPKKEVVKEQKKVVKEKALPKMISAEDVEKIIEARLAKAKAQQAPAELPVIPTFDNPKRPPLYKNLKK